jgi:hypothetical protein
MKQIEHEIKGIEFTIQSDKAYYLALSTANKDHASMLSDSITGIINLKYDYLEGMSVLFNIHNLSYDEVMRVNFPLNDETKLLMKAIDEKLPIFVFASYPNEHHPVNLYGQFHPVSY